MIKKWRPHFLWALSNGESQSRCLIQFRLQIRGPRMNPVEGTKVYVACTWDVSNRRPAYIITPQDPIIPTDQCCNSFSFIFSICMPTSISKPICMGARSRAPKCSIQGPVVNEKGLSLEPPNLRVSRIRPHNKLVVRVDNRGPRQKKLQNWGILLVESKHLDHKEFSLESGSN